MGIENEMIMIEINIYLWKMRWYRELGTPKEHQRNAGETEMSDTWRGPIVICVWKERENDVCGKKRGK